VAASYGVAAVGAVEAAGAQTVLEQTGPLVWVILGISIAGALITFAILAYAIWRFRDPAARGRRHG